jgi:hypothetical protein
VHANCTILSYQIIYLTHIMFIFERISVLFSHSSIPLDHYSQSFLIWLLTFDFLSSMLINFPFSPFIIGNEIHFLHGKKFRMLKLNFSAALLFPPFVWHLLSFYGLLLGKYIKMGNIQKIFFTFV